MESPETCHVSCPINLLSMNFEKAFFKILGFSPIALDFAPDEHQMNVKLLIGFQISTLLLTLYSFRLQHPKSVVSPQDYLDRLLYSRGYTTRPKKTLKSGYYATSTHMQQVSYHDHLISLARSGRNKKLKEIMECGISTNPCNTFGESLVHTVCRRCEPETLQILLDAGTSVQVSDDYGRTPLHDACWRAEPCFKIIPALRIFIFQALLIFRLPLRWHP